jgi:hypothetical protein
MNFPTGPTPPPPSLYPAPTEPAVQEPVGPGLSEPQRLLNTFIAPKKTFEDIRRNPSWWVPWLLASIFAVLFGFVVTQKMDMIQLARHQVEQVKFVQRQFEQLPPEQQQQQLRGRAIAMKISFYASPIFNLIIVLVVAAVMMAVFNFGFAAAVPFQRSLAIMFYATLPTIIAYLLLSASIWFNGNPDSIDIMGNPMATNPGFFMDQASNKFLYGLASGFDVFRLWIVALIGLGFAVNSERRKLSVSTAIVTTAIIYGCAIFALAGLRSAF